MKGILRQTMIIRNLEQGDISDLAKLYYQFWNEESDTQKMEEKFANLQNNESYILLGAVENDMLIGSVTGIICEELYGDCRPFLLLENMVVDSTYRGKGVGKALFEELENCAKARNCTQVILVTETDRKDACGFYESIGFHKTANKGYKKKIM